MMSTARIDEPPTYVFGRRDRGALLVGFRPRQVVVVSVGAAAILLGFLSAGGSGGLVGAAVLLAALVAALFPVQGRPLVDWVRPTINYGYLRLTGRTRYLGGPWSMRRNRYLP